MIDDIFRGNAQHPIMVAEIGANHQQSFGRAKRLVQLASVAGADAVKFQCYSPHTMTLDVDNKFTRIVEGPWAGKTLWGLYSEACMPWEWHEPLAKVAEEFGMEWFSTAYDTESADYLMGLKPAAIKIASFEASDWGLLQHVRRKSELPLIVSAGLLSNEDLEDYPEHRDMMLMHCVSAYPAALCEMRLSRMHELAKCDCPVGLSCHSLDTRAATMAVALGAKMIEVHLTDDRNLKTLDAPFSYEPYEFAALCAEVDAAYRALGGEWKVNAESARWCRHVYAVRDIEEGQRIGKDDIRLLRGPGSVEPVDMPYLVGKKAKKAYKRGEPI